MKVLAIKTNSGIHFAVLNKGGKPTQIRSVENRNALARALELYQAEVAKLSEEKEFTSARVRQVTERAFVPTIAAASCFIEHEPWGFAFGDSFETAQMGDTGSTPTDARAKTLWLFQAPFELIKRNGRFHYERVYDV